MSGRFRISRSRALCRDVLHFHRKIPLCPHDRLVNLSPLIQVRSQVSIRISWVILFLKAYALVAKDKKEFRQCYLTFPWLHGYEHDQSVGMIALEREYLGERWLFWGRFRNPAEKPLANLQTLLHNYQSQPVEKKFRKQLIFSRFPTLIRRLFWWGTLNLSGSTRANQAGTFFLTTLSSRGAEIQNPPAFHTGNLTYGPFDSEGRTRVTISYDHRLMDGALIAEFLEGMEETMNGVLLDELVMLSEAEPNSESTKNHS